MRVLFLAPSRWSRGDASIAADLARSLPRSQFRVGFVAAADSAPTLLDLGLPTLTLTSDPISDPTSDPISDPSADNLAVLDRIVRGFRPDCLVAADAFAVHESRDWSGLTAELLRTRYGRPVATFDRLGWPATNYRVDPYGGDPVQYPRLLDGYDLLIRTSPPHPVGPASPGTAVAALHPGGLRDGGLRSAGADVDERAEGDARPMVFLVNSPWEYRNRLRSLPAAQLIDALPRVVHSHLAALDRPLRVVHVGPRAWRFPPAEQIEYRHFSRMPYAMFQARLAAADLFLTTNVLSMTLAQAVLGGVPALVLHNHDRLGPDAIPGWLADIAPLLRVAYPFRVAPLGWHDLLESLLSGNPYAGCFASAGVFDRPAVLRALVELLDDQPSRARLRQRQQDYRDQLAAMPPAAEAIRAAVTA